jgi:endonuclease G
MKVLRVVFIIIVLAIAIWLIITFVVSPVNSPPDSTMSAAVKGVDTVIDEGIYQSYFSYAFKEPVFVKYTLYHGGGPCSRSHFKFHNDTEISTATAQDYFHSGYDEGHLADAEDFAYDCDADEKTFRFFNCVPQTPHLNRGQWKHWETEIRKESQDDSLLIITGSIFGNEVIGDHVYVPVYCWKVAESLTTKSVMHVIICDNTPEAHCDEVSIEVLQSRLGYALPLRK